MRMIFTFFFLGVILLSQNGLAQDLKHIRTHYQKATTEKAVCQSLIKDLKDEKISNLELAYLGALETIWAKYEGNPFSKLRTFKKGREKIEQAVNEEPHNMEIRCLRLWIQKNAPSFLGYDDKIKEDEQFLKKNIHSVSSRDLKKRINNVLKQ